MQLQSDSCPMEPMTMIYSLYIHIAYSQSLVQPPSGDRRVTHACEGGAADSTRGTRERSRDKPQGMFPGPPRDSTEWRSPSQAEHLLKQFRGRSPSELPNPQRDRRHVRCAVALQLLTVEKNPGPVRREWRRDKSEEKKERRRVRRAEGRRRKRKTQRPGSRKTTEIVTWNVQGLSLRENNRRRLRRTIAYIERRKWDITLLTEIRAESRGMLWFGEEESETAVIHSEKTAVVLRGEEMRRWREERQRRRFSERSTTVKIGNMKIMAVYQPLWSNGREGVERYREEIEEELAGSSREEVLIIGGDHNAQIGRGEEMEGVKGKYGLHTPTNEAGHHLLEWCQEQGLSYV